MKRTLDRAPFFLIAVLFLLLSTSADAFAQTKSKALPRVNRQSAAQGAPASQLKDPAVERKIEALLKQMTLDEKIGQMNQFSFGAPTGPGTSRSEYGEMIAAGKLGSVFNLTGAKETNQLQRAAMTKSRLKIPIIFGLDVIHGYRTTFPIPLALAATWNPELVQQTASAAAHEAAAEGVRWTFSPMIDISRDARWGRIIEGAGEDPFLGSAMARAYVMGYQGARLSDPGSIAACAKHFVGYGAAEAGREYNTTQIPERLLREVYLAPFNAAVNAGAATLMSAFNDLNDVPASANPFTIKQILKKEWGFRGFVVSDWTSIKEVIAHGIANDGPTAARKAVLAGVDMDMEGELYISTLAAQVKSGAVPVSVIDDAVRRILRVKFALGLFDNPYANEKVLPANLDAAHVDLARTAAEQSFVLLKNEKGVLPLSAAAKTIAVIGPLADDADAMLGAWGGKGDAKNVITLQASLQDFADKHHMRLLHEKGTEIRGGTDAGIPAAVNAARQADVVLLAVGESAGDMTGEAASRTVIDLPGLQTKLLEAVAAAGKPTVLIVFSGRPLTLTPVVDKVNAVVQAWHPGIQAGPALWRVLSGQANFSGKLTVSMPRAVGQLPLYYNALNTGRPHLKVDLTHPPTNGDEKYVSRYIDELNAPLFPFGYGLSYTKFDYSRVSISAKSLSSESLNADSQSLKVSVDVKNTGERDGVEVAELYLGERGTSISRPVRELKGFQRVALKAGESKQVEFTVGKEQLRFWNIDMRQIVEPGIVTVWVGPDSQTENSAEFSIGK